MSDLSTTYMGIKLRNPIVVAACSLSGKIDNIQRAEDAGAGALVIKSLFEEQINLERQELEDAENIGAERFAESLTYFPKLGHAGAREHLMWVEKSRKAVKMPLIGSLNATTPGKWISYAKSMQDTGVDGLELNLYEVQADIAQPGSLAEQRLFDIVQRVGEQVSIPISVKLSPFYTSVVNVAAQLADRGVKGLVMFNRFLQPDIDIEKQELVNTMVWSRQEEMRLPLRYIAILHGRIAADLAASSGVQQADGVIKMLLAGASIVQVASTLYVNKIGHIVTMTEGLVEWMQQKGYQKLSDFRGKLSQQQVPDPTAFERAQYVELLMKQRT